MVQQRVWKASTINMSMTSSKKCEISRRTTPKKIASNAHVQQLPLACRTALCESSKPQNSSRLPGQTLRSGCCYFEDVACSGIPYVHSVALGLPCVCQVQVQLGGQHSLALSNLEAVIERVCTSVNGTPCEDSQVFPAGGGDVCSSPTHLALGPRAVIRVEHVHPTSGGSIGMRFNGK